MLSDWFDHPGNRGLGAKNPAVTPAPNEALEITVVD